MPETQPEIVSRMRQALQLSDPDVDTTIGSPVRKIIDVVGEVMAEASVETNLYQYQYDIYAKQGSDLDDFVRLFGYTRFPAKRASGMVIFERSTPATEAIAIPLGTQLSTEGVAPVIVQTITPAMLAVGDTNISVPVQAVIGGANGNVPANSIRRRITAFDGITSFTNPSALTGGADAEDDEQLRTRFVRTVFRGMAGTEHMFLGTALNDEAVTHANVLGASERFRESVEVVGGTATSSMPASNIRYVYPRSSVVGEDIDNGVILTPDVHYTFNPTIPPTITSLNPAEMPNGVYDFEYEYVPTGSRNDPATGITNRIDIYVNGVRSTEATEVAIFSTSKLFNTTAGSPLNRNNFRRDDGVTLPVANNFFLPFAFSPAIDASVNDQIVIGANTYIEGTHYWMVNDITNQGGSPSSLSGIEIRATANGAPFQPANNSIVPLNYLFNAVPRDIELAVRQWRLVTTDVRVHQAVPIYLNLHLAIIFEQGYPPVTVIPEIEAELERHISTIGFNQVVQVSDLLTVAQNVAGTDAVRFLTNADNATNFAIQRVSPTTGAVITTYHNGGTPQRAIDVIVGDSEYPVFNSVTVVPKSQNSFGAV